ncbi:TetR/AcrR family transcriptional regulator [Intrasporangium mesophilum]
MTSKARRRRGATLEKAILDAAWAELGEKGWAGFTVEGVCARAEAAKAVVYRRWRNRVELVEDLLRRETDSLSWERERSVDLRADLLSFLQEMADFLGSPFGGAVWGVMYEGDMSRRPSVLEGPTIIGRVQTIFDEALVRGELVTEPPPSVMNLGHSSMMSEFLHTGRPASIHGIEAILNDLWLPAIMRSQRGRG